MDRSNIVEMLDEDGNILELEQLMEYEYEGDTYLCLVVVDDTDLYSKNDALIVKVTQDANGDEVFVPLESREAMMEQWQIVLQFLDDLEEAGLIEEE